MKRLLAFVIGMSLVFVTAASAVAEIETSLGAEFQVGFFSGDTISDNNYDWGTMAGWFTLSITTKKEFGEKANAWFTLDVQPVHWPCQGGWEWIDWEGLTPEELEANRTPPIEHDLKIIYGYTYKFNEKLSMTLGDLEGITRSDGLLGSEDGDGWGYGDWDKLFDGKGDGLTIKVDYNPLYNLSIVAAFEPFKKRWTDGATGEYLVKATYTGDRFRIGGDFNNATEPDPDPDDPDVNAWEHVPWDIWGEVYVMDGLKFYADYTADKRYYVEGEYTMSPITVTARYANIDGDYGNYKAETLDVNIDYELSEELTLTGGLAYRLDPSEVAKFWAGVAWNRLTVKIADDFDWDDISLYGTYQIDDSNQVEFYYSFSNGNFGTKLYVDLW